MYIYKTTNLINGKIYIGQSIKDVDNSENYLGSGLLFNGAVEEFGKENFTKEILRFCKTQKELDVFESIMIKRFDSINNETGYNILTGTKNYNYNEEDNFHHQYKDRMIHEKEELNISINLNTDFLDSELSIIDVIIYKCIKEYCIRYEKCDLTSSELSKLLNSTFPTINRSILKLKELEYIKIEFKRNNKNKRIIRLCNKEK